MKITNTIFPAMCVQAGLPEPVAEFRFAPPRKWRFDWLFITHRLALEIEGGVWASKNGKKSRHFHGAGAIADMEKYAEAAILNYRVIRVTTKDFQSGKAIDLLKRAML